MVDRLVPAIRPLRLNRANSLANVNRLNKLSAVRVCETDPVFPRCSMRKSIRDCAGRRPHRPDTVNGPRTPPKKAEASLKVGDPAPALKATKWLQGTEVKSFEKGQVYVVEFWATWCGPCIVMMPHMSDLQQEYKGKAYVHRLLGEGPEQPRPRRWPRSSRSAGRSCSTPSPTPTTATPTTPG